MLSRPLRYTAQGAAALIVAVGAVGVAHVDKAVALSVDGSKSSVHVFGSTVGDVLEKQGIELGEHDTVVPSVASPIEDGDHISVRYGRQLTVAVDGKSEDYWTTATTVDAALQEIGLRTEGAALSASRSQPLGRQGMVLGVTTPKKVKLTVDGKTRTVTTTSRIVSGVLADGEITRGLLDRVKPGLDAEVEEGMKIVVKRVTVKDKTTTKSIAFKTTEKEDSSLAQGTTEVVTAGKAGKKKVVSRNTYVDGKLDSSTVIREKVVSKPVNAVVKVGTKVTSSSSTAADDPAPSAGNTSGAGINLANAAMWDRIAQCESGGNWSINTGNGYYGGLQFAQQTWVGWGGTDFASRADLASRAEQITVANRLYADMGLQPWGCAHAA